MGGEAGFVAQKSIRFGLRVLLLFPLDMSRAAVVVWGGSKRPLVSTLRVVAPDNIPADVKATSRAPFPHP